MNDALKLLSNALKPFGYHIRKYGAPNILRLRGLEQTEHAENITSLRRAGEQGFLPENSNLNHMIIYLRTCVRSSRNIDLSKRLTGAPLLENTLRCIRSLVTACNQDRLKNPQQTLEVVALDDRSDAPALDAIERELKALTCRYTIRQTHNTGQGESLYQQFDEAREQNALVYFCEDDYLHEPDAITTCRDFYEHVANNLQTHCLIYPQEHAVLYDDHYPSYILKGSDRHWRTMRHATHTFITHGHVVHRFWDYFKNTRYVGIKKKRKLGSEARTTNRLFHHIPGFSPLKPAAVHLQFENTLPPLYDWRPLWDAQEG